MDHKAFFELVKQMRFAQKNYSKGGSAVTKNDCVALEHKVDELIKDQKEGPRLPGLEED